MVPVAGLSAVAFLIFVTMWLHLVNLGYSDYQGDEISALPLPNSNQSLVDFLLTQKKGPVQRFDRGFNSHRPIPGLCHAVLHRCALRLFVGSIKRAVENQGPVCGHAFMGAGLAIALRRLFSLPPFAAILLYRWYSTNSDMPVRIRLKHLIVSSAIAALLLVIFYSFTFFLFQPG